MQKVSDVRRLAFGLLLFLVLASYSHLSLAGDQLAIIIDDIGYNLPLGRRAADLPGDFTLAVLPFTPHATELAERAHKRGKEIMLHAPMSNRRNYPLGRGGLVSGMEQAEFLQVLRQNLASIPHLKGVNNHMGSLLTEQAEPMGWLMKELKQRDLYFVDSRTSAQTQALIMAERIQLPSRRRDVFLDDDRSPRNIRDQLMRAIKQADQQGSALAIGHPHPETLAQLEKLQPLLDEYGVTLVKASRLMVRRQSASPKKSDPGHKNDNCMAPPMNLWPQIWAPIDPFAVDKLLRP